MSAARAVFAPAFPFGSDRAVTARQLAVRGPDWVRLQSGGPAGTWTISPTVDAVQEVTGFTPVLSTTGGTSDARFIKDVCPVIEFGTTGRTAHMVDERVQVATLEGLVAVYHRVLTGYFSTK